MTIVNSLRRSSKGKKTKKKKKIKKLRSGIELRNFNFSGVFIESGRIHFLTEPDSAGH